VAAGVLDIGEDTGGTTEDIVFQGNPVKDGDIVLQFNIIADIYILADKHILPYSAVLTDSSVGHDMRKVPDFSAIINVRWFFDQAGGVDKVAVATD